jgi:L-ascorbate metabolism protein UlaG (beta-lactamase superfamily)
MLFLGRVAERFRTSVPEEIYHHEKRPVSARLAVQWVGTAGFRVVSGEHHFWIDPHLSRHSLAELVMGPITPKLDLIERTVDVAHAVAAGHSHFDHAIDVPAVAKLRGARVYGSSDTLNYCRGSGVAEPQLHEIGGGEDLREGPFRFRAVLSRHSTIFFGHVPFPGRIDRPLAPPLRASDLRVGTVFGFHLETEGGSVYHIGSANLVETEMTGLRADVVLCCTVGRQSTERYTARVLDALRPRVVIPCHWDQFWRPLDEPARQIPTNDLEGFLREVAAHPLAPEVRVLPLCGWTRIA